MTVKVTMKVKLILRLIDPWDMWLKRQFQWTWRVLAMWLLLFCQLEVAFSAACRIKVVKG